MERGKREGGEGIGDRREGKREMGPGGGGRRISIFLYFGFKKAD